MQGDHVTQQRGGGHLGRPGAGGAGRAASPEPAGAAAGVGDREAHPDDNRNVEPHATWSARQPPLKGSMSTEGASWKTS